MKDHSIVKTITVSFSQGELVGEIFIDMMVGKIHERVTASFAFPPFDEMIEFLEKILENRLPSEFVLDEEGIYKKFNALPGSAPNLFIFVLGFPAHIFIEGVFDKRQFVLEFYNKLTAFLSAGYDKNLWTNGNESLDLKRISLEKLEKLLE